MPDINIAPPSEWSTAQWDAFLGFMVMLGRVPLPLGYLDGMIPLDGA